MNRLKYGGCYQMHALKFWMKMEESGQLVLNETPLC